MTIEPLRYLAFYLLVCLSTFLWAVATRVPEGFVFCFHANQASERGTEKAMFDYAMHTRTMYNINVSIIFPDSVLKLEHSPRSSLRKFRAHFPVYTYYAPEKTSGGPNLVSLANERCSVLYMIKAGPRSSHPQFPASFAGTYKTAVHAVFYWQPHGDAYAAVGESFVGKKNPLVVPHMVVGPSRKSNETHSSIAKILRKDLGIDPAARVFCRHGARDTFSSRIAQLAVEEIAEKYGPQKVHFILMNTNNFVKTPLSNLHFIESNVNDIEYFFDACDAMIHGRADGETFGLAVAEFSVRNKPVLTNADGKDTTHIGILGDKAFVYHNVEECKNFMSDLIENGIPQKDFNAYRAYSPEVVMPIFKKVFIDPFIMD